MQEIIKDELDKYKDILAKNGFSDVENLKGKQLRLALKLIQRHKKSAEKSAEMELDQKILREIRHFL